jgi:wyosine [tRNA(Phe)-imidazoG37] synthetase (radical SAM superfamily)
MSKLNINDHSRDSAGLTYVYPVWSRRSQGLSIGINLNPNNACNWACRYCQVPNLTRGTAPACDIPKLQAELRGLLEEHRSGTLAHRFELDVSTPIRDIAISGNGEPTSCPNFAEVTHAIGEIAQEFNLLGNVGLIVITNGSLMGHATVQEGLRKWGKLGGQAWFKMDRGTTEGIFEINGARVSIERVREHLALCLNILPTWIQTCLVTLDDAPLSETDIQGYLETLETLIASEQTPKGVMLYGLARPSEQPEAYRLSTIKAEEREALTDRLKALGLEVRVNP